jgi:hypothetical protein
MATAITTTTATKKARIKFRDITSENAFDSVFTSIVLKTNLNTVTKRDGVKLTIDGVLDGVGTKLLVADSEGKTDTVNIVSKRSANVSYGNVYNSVTTPLGTKDNEIFTSIGSSVTTKYLAATYERSIPVGNFIISLERGGRYIIVTDTETNASTYTYIYGTFRYVRNIFSDSDYIYISSYRYNDRVFRITRDKVVSGFDTSDFETIMLDFAGIESRIRLCDYYTDFIVFNNTIFMSFSGGYVLAADLDIKTVYYVNKALKLDSYLSAFQIVDKELYLIGTYNGKTVYKLDIVDSVATQNVHFTHTTRLNNYTKSFLVVNSNVICLYDRQVIDIKGKKVYALDAFFPDTSMMRAQPVIINGTLMSYTYNKLYKLALDTKKVRLLNSTSITLDREPSVTPEKVTLDLDLSYNVYVGEELKESDLSDISVLLKSNMVVTKYITNLDKTNTIMQELIIGKDRVLADKLVTHCYAIEG